MSAHVPHMFLRLVTLLEHQGWPAVPSVMRVCQGTQSAAPQEDDCRAGGVSERSLERQRSVIGSYGVSSPRRRPITADVAPPHPAAAPMHSTPSESRDMLLAGVPTSHRTVTTGATSLCACLKQAVAAASGHDVPGRQAVIAPMSFLDDDPKEAHGAADRRSLWEQPSALPTRSPSIFPTSSHGPQGPPIGWINPETGAAVFTHAVDECHVPDMPLVGREGGLHWSPYGPGPSRVVQVRRTSPASTSARHASQSSLSGESEEPPEHPPEGRGTPIGPSWVPTGEGAGIPPSVGPPVLPSGHASRRVPPPELARQTVSLRSARYGISRSQLYSGLAEQGFPESHSVKRIDFFGSPSEELLRLASRADVNPVRSSNRHSLDLHLLVPRADVNPAGSRNFQSEELPGDAHVSSPKRMRERRW